MKNRLILTAGFALTSVNIQGAVVYSNDFDAETLGSAPASPFAHSGHSSTSSDVVAGGTNGFATQHVDFVARDNGNYAFALYDSNLTTTLTSDVATFSFDLRFNENDSQFRLRPRAGIVGADDITRNINLNSGGSAVTIDQNFTYDIIVNNSAGAVAVENGVGSEATLAVDSSAIYENGSLLAIVVNNRQAGAAQGDAVEYLTLWARGTGAAGVARSIQMDNFVVRDNAFITTIPEPSTVALFGLAALGLFGRRRKTS